MAVLGDRLLAAEAGWLKIESNESPLIEVLGWKVDGPYPSAYSGDDGYCYYGGQTARFGFNGTKLRIVGINYATTDVNVIIDGVTYNYTQQPGGNVNAVLMFEKTDLPAGNHTVIIDKVGGSIGFDAIHIDDTGVLLHSSGLSVKTDLSNIEIGDVVQADYEATSNVLGVIKNLGNPTKTVSCSPTTPSTAPNGIASFICVDKDDNGGSILVADRVIQSGINYSKMYEKGLLEGRKIQGLECLVHGNSLTDASANQLTIAPNSGATVVVSNEQQRFGNDTFKFNGTGSLKIGDEFNGIDFSIVQDFTIEFDIYVNSGGLVEYPSPLVFRGGSNGNGYWINIRNTGEMWFGIYGGSKYGTILPAGSIVEGQWNHVVVVRDGINLFGYINGTKNNWTTDFTGYEFPPNMITAAWAGGEPDNTQPLNGYMANIRIINGIKAYTKDFSTPTTELLLNMETSSFVDSSTNVKTVTASNVTHNTSDFKFGSGSAQFNGSNSVLSYQSTAANEFGFGSGDFTIEGFFKFSATNLYQTLCCTDYNGIGKRFYLMLYNDGTFFVSNENDIYANYGEYGSLLNQWNHLALVRNGSSMNLYVNGVGRTPVDVGSKTLNGDNNDFHVGNLDIIANAFNGLADNIRVTKGKAVYTEDFTPPVIALDNATYVSADAPTAQHSNTEYKEAVEYKVPTGGISYADYSDQRIVSCLLHGDGDNGSKNIIDSSLSNNQIEVIGNVNISTTQSKFNGSSIYSDGTGQLNIVNNGSFDFSDYNFTIEMNIYPEIITSGSTYMTLIAKALNDVAGSYLFTVRDDGEIYAWLGSGSGWNIANTVLIGSGVTHNQWNHIAIVRNGNALTCYVNGVGGTPLNITGLTFAVSNDDVKLMDWITGSHPYKGYKDEIRVVKGKALYTTNFTPPIAAFVENTPDYMLGGAPSSTNKGNGAFPEFNDYDKYVVRSSLGGKIHAGSNRVWNWDCGVLTTILDVPKDNEASYAFRGRDSVTKFTFGTASHGFRPILKIHKDGNIIK